jgi:DNA-binding NarL/FixJ family response regulator
METAGVSQGTASAAFLVVEDDEGVARTIARALRSSGAVTVVHSRAGALDALRSRAHWTALFIDLHLPDGDGLEVIRACKLRQGSVAAMVITGDHRKVVMDEAFDVDAIVIIKPFEPERLRKFASDAIAGHASGSARVARHVREWQERYRLTPAEACSLHDAASGRPRGELPAARGVTQATVKNQVHSLLSKTGDRSMDAAVIRFLGELVGGPVDFGP